MTSLVLALAKIPNEIFLLLGDSIEDHHSSSLVVGSSPSATLLVYPTARKSDRCLAPSPSVPEIHSIRMLCSLKRTERLASIVSLRAREPSHFEFSLVIFTRLATACRHLVITYGMKQSITPMKGASDCQSARCGMDAGCLKQSDGSFICVCTHDFSQEMPGTACPRKVVSGTNSQYPVTNKTLITIHRSGQDHDHGFKAHPTISVLADQSADHSSPIKAVALAYSVPIAIVLALIGLAFASVRLIRWIRIYRMTHRNRPALRFGRSVAQKEYLTINTDYLKIVNEVEQLNVSSLSFFLLREWIELDSELGEGCFGKVFRGRLRRPDSSLQPTDPSYINVESSQPVAIKVLKSPSPGIASATAQRDLLREAETMASFSHENILALHGIVINEFSIGPWIVFEYMELGDLAQLLRSANGYPSSKDKDSLILRHLLNQEDLRSVAEQIANGMKYLSSRNFVHRDLACRNCLVGERPSVNSAFANSRSNLIIKISDFGMSRDVHITDYYKMGGSRFLPVRWMSPESILYGKFSQESDVWSFGVVLWEIFSMGAQPYYGHSNEEVITMIVDCIHLEPPKSTPFLIRQLMTEGCWKKMPSDRPSFSEIQAKLASFSGATLSEQAENEVISNCYTYLQPLPDLES